MESVHFKTIDPVSQDLLRGASRKGLTLNWDRYEKQQPQDGFLRLGLSCPYGCMQGPCRIDPYGRGADRGICGLDRDGMTAAFLLRLTLMGTLEKAAVPGDFRSAAILRPPLEERAASLAHAGGVPLSRREISESALLLSRPSGSPEALVQKAVRLSLLSLATSTGGKDRAMKVRAGCGLLAGKAVFIGLAGSIPASRVREIRKKIGGRKKEGGRPEVRLVTLGDWIPAGDAYLPIACTSGEAETVLSSGKLNLLVAGPQADPGLFALCEKLGVPVLAENAGAASIVERALASFDRRIVSSFTPDPALIGEGRTASSFENGTGERIALIGGSDSLLQSLGQLPVELARSLIGRDFTVAAWGDAAVWTIKQGLAVTLLGAGRGPLAAVESMVSSGTLSKLSGIFFTGLKGCGELTRALGLAALGMRVSIGVPLPLWGSEKVCRLLDETLAASGGLLTHLDHPARVEETLEWFLG
jgi:hypothetical protein